jgi:hypothetical protein
MRSCDIVNAPLSLLFSFGAAIALERYMGLSGAFTALVTMVALSA